MIGGLMARLRVSTAAAALAAGLSALPQLGQQRTLSSRPGSGIVKRSGGRSPRPEKTMAIRIKRLRKNVKRHRDAIRCWHNNPCRRGVLTDYVVGFGNGK